MAFRVSIPLEQVLTGTEKATKITVASGKPSGVYHWKFQHPFLVLGVRVFSQLAFHHYASNNPYLGIQAYFPEFRSTLSGSLTGKSFFGIAITFPFSS